MLQKFKKNSTRFYTLQQKQIWEKIPCSPFYPSVIPHYHIQYSFICVFMHFLTWKYIGSGSRKLVWSTNFYSSITSILFQCGYLLVLLSNDIYFIKCHQIVQIQGLPFQRRLSAGICNPLPAWDRGIREEDGRRDIFLENTRQQFSWFLE